MGNGLKVRNYKFHVHSQDMEESANGTGWTRFPRAINGGMMRACLSADIPSSWRSLWNSIIAHNQNEVKKRTNFEKVNLPTSWP